MKQTLYIDPTNFIANNGKLDVKCLYIHKVNSNGDFVFTIGKTLKLTYRGFVYDVNDRHLYLRSDDSNFVANFMEITYK